MKRALWIVSLLALIMQGSLFSDESFMLNINGGYKKCSVYSYKYHFNLIDSNSKILDTIYIYNDQGMLINKFDSFYFDNIIEEIVYKDEVNILYKNIYVYSE
ncbi:MAG: hypothetical protein NT007_05290 [Candidatus Kapabacteria bacterium]|nr:hypothetical protein [Candidatus Kapabacteria bacterium]